MNQSYAFDTLEAVHLLKQALFFDKHNPYVHCSISYRYQLLAEAAPSHEEKFYYFALAQAHAERALQLDAGYALSYKRKSEILLAQKELYAEMGDVAKAKELETEAIVSLEEGVKKEPNNEHLKTGLAKIAKHSGIILSQEPGRH